MKTFDHPLPNVGGAYIRHPDGSLTPEQEIDAPSVDAVVPEPETTAAAPVAAAKAAKTVKET
jgi:hypothetical protein